MRQINHDTSPLIKNIKAMKIKTISYLLLLFCLNAFAAEPEFVAHRGAWNLPGSAQNSIRALQLADSLGFFASEFDVWMTRDSVPVVNHDSTINGINIEQASYPEIKDQRLSNGEAIPTLRQYLDCAKNLKIRLVCELKAHDSARHEQLAVDSILAMVKEYGLTGRTDYITFSYNAFKRFIKQAPAPAEVYYLTGELTPDQIKALGGHGIDYSLGTMRRHPEWIDRAHELGLKVNIWTVTRPDDIKWCIDHGADFITTNNPFPRQ